MTAMRYNDRPVLQYVSGPWIITEHDYSVSVSNGWPENRAVQYRDAAYKARDFFDWAAYRASGGFTTGVGRNIPVTGAVLARIRRRLIRWFPPERGVYVGGDRFNSPEKVEAAL